MTTEMVKDEDWVILAKEREGEAPEAAAVEGPAGSAPAPVKEAEEDPDAVMVAMNPGDMGEGEDGGNKAAATADNTTGAAAETDPVQQRETNAIHISVREDAGADAEGEKRESAAAESNEIHAEVHEKVNAGSTPGPSPPFCASCSGCAVDWRAASTAAMSGRTGCRGHGECTSCDIELKRINETYSLKRFAREKTVRDTGASSATVIRAMLPDGSRPFVKFVCIPGLPRHNTNCPKGKPWPPEDRLVTNTLSLQRLTDFCGMERISSRSWVAHVRGTAPAGLPLDPWNVHPVEVPIDQRGIFSSPAAGIAVSALCAGKEGPNLLNEVPSYQVVEAALFDFVFCGGDRHTQNVFIDEDANIRLIDNDNLLGQQVLDVGKNRLCAVSSLFLPGNMESWRLRKSQYCNNRLSTLDYRCHVGPAGEVKLPPQLQKCLKHFANTKPEAIVEEFGLGELAFAKTLQERSNDLLTHGLPKALKMAGAREYEISQEHAHERPVNKLWDEVLPHEREKIVAWRDSMWRPTEPAVCHGMKAKWDGAPFDYRADTSFEGGE